MKKNAQVQLKTVMSEINKVFGLKENQDLTYTATNGDHNTNDHRER